MASYHLLHVAHDKKSGQRAHQNQWFRDTETCS